MKQRYLGSGVGFSTCRVQCVRYSGVRSVRLLQTFVINERFSLKPTGNQHRHHVWGCVLFVPTPPLLRECWITPPLPRAVAH